MPERGGTRHYEMMVVQSDHHLRTAGMPYRVITVPPDISLYEFAAIITRSFDFDFDHPFGFYDDLKDPYEAARGYELFADMGEESDFPGVKKTRLDQVFEQPKQKWLFLFDYGDEWNFIVSKTRETRPEPGGFYPRIVRSEARPFPQYPDSGEMPEDPDLLLLEAMEYLGLDDGEGALKRMEALLSKDAWNREAVLGKAFCLLLLDRDREVLDLLGRLARKRPGDAAPLLARAAVMSMEDEKGARIIWEEACRAEMGIPVTRDFITMILLEFTRLTDVFERFDAPAGNAYLLYLQGEWLVDLEEYEGAEECFQEALEVDGGSKWIITRRAFALFEMERYEEVLESISTIGEQDADDVDYMQVLGMRVDSMVKLGRMEEALDATDETASMIPDDVDIACTKSNLLMLMGRRDEAVEILEGIVDTDPLDGEARELLHKAMASPTQDELILRIISGIMRGELNDIEMVFSGFVDSVEIRDDSRALDEMIPSEGRQDILDLIGGDPRKEECACLLVRMLYHLAGEHQRTYFVFQEMLELVQDDPRGLMGQLASFWMIEHIEETLVNIDQAIAESPNLVLPLVMKGNLLRIDRRTDEALEIYERVLEIDPEEESAVEGKALVLTETRGNAAALDFLDSYLKRHPDHLTALHLRVDTGVEERDPRALLRDVKKILRLDPEDEWALWMRMDLCFVLRRDGEAFAAVKKLLALYPESAGILVENARDLDSTGRSRIALTLLDRVLKADPSNQEATDLRSAVERRAIEEDLKGS